MSRYRARQVLTYRTLSCNSYSMLCYTSVLRVRLSVCFCVHKLSLCRCSDVRNVPFMLYCVRVFRSGGILFLPILLNCPNFFSFLWGFLFLRILTTLWTFAVFHLFSCHLCTGVLCMRWTIFLCVCNVCTSIYFTVLPSFVTNFVYTLLFVQKLLYIVTCTSLVTFS